MVNNIVYLKLATIEDFDYYYAVKCEHLDILWGGHLDKPNKKVLLDYFTNKLQNPTLNMIYIIRRCCDDAKVGYVYLDRINPDCVEISIGVSEIYAGNGYGQNAIDVAIFQAKKMGYGSIIALIREDNHRSIHIFSKNNFVKTEKSINRRVLNLNRDITMYEWKYPMDE